MTTKLDDLAASVKSGEIAGAALDVFEVEPLPKDHPLWTMPNVLLSARIRRVRVPHLNERRYQILLNNTRAMVRASRFATSYDKANWF